MSAEGKKLAKCSLEEVNAMEESVEEKPVLNAQLQKVRPGARWGLLNSEGEGIFEADFDEISYVNGLWQVQKEGQLGYFSLEKEWVWPLQD